MRCVIAAALLGMLACARPQAASVREVQIDLDKAVEISMPSVGADLKPVAFTTPDGREGWVVRIPGGRPIATPAIADRLLFVGGGYGSHEFYAFDARSGALIWQIRTNDDGPTAAVVEDGLVAFNTESCTVIVVEARTGKVVWQEWLGDPLMSQPAIWKGRLYIAYPAGQKGRAETGHRMLCADLRTGKHLWEQEIAGDAISAPVIDDERLFFTCFDGTSFCLKADDGAVVWKRKNEGTSAPLVVGGQVIVTQKQERGTRAIEGLKRIDAKKGAEQDRDLLAAGQADYLQKGKGGNTGIQEHAQKALDSGVGFSAAPQAARLDQAESHLGVNTVAGAWAFQGSRAAYRGGQIMNCQGNNINCLSMDGRMAWRGVAKGGGLRADAQIFSPPALGGRLMYLCSVQGHLLSVSQKDGSVGFMYATKQPMPFQPALAGGCMYVGTVNGLLVCLRTGDRECDGWTMWGGNAQHNKKD